MSRRTSAYEVMTISRVAAFFHSAPRLGPFTTSVRKRGRKRLISAAQFPTSVVGQTDERGEAFLRRDGEEREDLHGLAEAHFVREDEVAAAGRHAVEPRHARLLVFAELPVEDLGIQLGTDRRTQHAVVVQLQAQEIDRHGAGQFRSRVRPVIRRVARDADDLGVGIVVRAGQIRDDRLKRGGQTPQGVRDPHEMPVEDGGRQVFFAFRSRRGQVVPADRRAARAQAHAELEPVRTGTAERRPQRQAGIPARERGKPGAEQEIASFAFPARDHFLDEHADRLPVAQTVHDRRPGHGAFRAVRESEMDQLLVALFLLARVAEPEHRGMAGRAEARGVGRAELIAVVEHHGELQRAVVEKTPVVDRAELAFAHLHARGRQDADGQVLRRQQKLRRLVVARLNGRAQEIADPRHVVAGGQPPVFAEHADPAAAASGDDLHVLQRQGRVFDQDGRPQQASRAEFFEQEHGRGLFRVDDDPLVLMRKTRESGQAVEELGALFRRERQRLMLQLLGVDREEPDDLAVLRREGSEAERGGRLVEMKLAEIGLVARVGARPADQIHMQMHIFPLARGVRKLGFGFDLDVGGMFAQKLRQEFGDPDEPESGELRRQIRQLRFLVLLDRVFGMVQGGRHRVRTESGEFAAAGACAGKWAVREAPDLGVRHHAVRVPADGAKHPAFDLVAAEQTAAVQDLLRFLEHFFRTRRD